MPRPLFPQRHAFAQRKQNLFVHSQRFPRMHQSLAYRLVLVLEQRGDQRLIQAKAAFGRLGFEQNNGRIYARDRHEEKTRYFEKNLDVARVLRSYAQPRILPSPRLGYEPLRKLLLQADDRPREIRVDDLEEYFRRKMVRQIAENYLEPAEIERSISRATTFPLAPALLANAAVSTPSPAPISKTVFPEMGMADAILLIAVRSKRKTWLQRGITNACRHAAFSRTSNTFPCPGFQA